MGIERNSHELSSGLTGRISVDEKKLHLFRSASSKTVTRPAKTCRSVPGPLGVRTLRPRKGNSLACAWLKRPSASRDSGGQPECGFSPGHSDRWGLERF